MYSKRFEKETFKEAVREKCKDSVSEKILLKHLHSRYFRQFPMP